MKNFGKVLSKEGESVGKVSKLKFPQLNLLTIQTTRACNQRCLYCYQDGGSFKSSERITFDIIKKLIDDLMSYHEAIGSSERISITFHGGEPLLLGHNFFRDVLAHLRALEGAQKRDIFSLSVQSNLTLLDQLYCDIFKEYNVSISTSIDGPSWLHNKFRGSGDVDNHASVMRHVDLARKNGLNVGAICIITADKLSHAQDIYDFFCAHSMNFKTNPPFLHGQAHKNRDLVGISVDEYTAFIINLFDLWYAKKPKVIVENLFDIIAIVLNGAGAGSCMNSNCSEKHITITPDGDCYTCGRTTGNPTFCYGNIKRSSISDMGESRKLRYLTNRVPDNIEVCSGCNFRQVCFSGCMYEAYLQHGTIYSPDRNCEAFKAIYTHIHNRIKTDLIVELLKA
jgi:uncharacterized protein